MDAVDRNIRIPPIDLLYPKGWDDYELLDSGHGAKLERFGIYTFIRPEHQALWKPSLPEARWKKAHAVFKPTHEESGGVWQFNQPVKTPWQMRYRSLKFLAFTSGSRHMGVFPEQSVHWDWMETQIAKKIKSGYKGFRVLNLFGYTGIATLAASQAGAHVTHVDASKKSIILARENQRLSKLEGNSIRWLVDDAFKFVRREVRRGNKYEGIVLDPPKFGRGPQGQVWEIFESLPELLENCRQLLSDQADFILLTSYAIRASSLSIYYALQEMVSGLGGQLQTGELTLVESSAGRLLSTANYVRWSIS